jgi:ribose 5-phosphate isomerase B
MRVAIAGDHAGFRLKEAVAAHLRAAGHDVVDLGARDEAPSDYPDFAAAVGEALAARAAERAVLVCGSGVGAVAAANKMPGVIAGLCHDTYSAHQGVEHEGVEHDQLNVLALGARVVGEALALDIVDAFVDAQFDGVPRHLRRVEKLRALERRAGRNDG